MIGFFAGAALAALLPDVPTAIRAVAAAMLLPAVSLSMELLRHRVTVTTTTVTDTTWRSTSTTDGAAESYTILSGPVMPLLSLSQRQLPSSIVWIAMDGSKHLLSLQWFRLRDRYAIVAAVQAL